MKRNALLLLALLALISAKADDITVNGTRRNYQVYAPKNLGS